MDRQLAFWGSPAGPLIGLFATMLLGASVLMAADTKGEEAKAPKDPFTPRTGTQQERVRQQLHWTERQLKESRRLQKHRLVAAEQAAGQADFLAKSLLRLEEDIAQSMQRIDAFRAALVAASDAEHVVVFGQQFNRQKVVENLPDAVKRHDQLEANHRKAKELAVVEQRKADSFQRIIQQQSAWEAVLEARLKAAQLEQKYLTQYANQQPFIQPDPP